MYGRLKAHLTKRKLRLKGRWIKKNSSYEKDLCAALEVEREESRYWDASWHGILLEFKKGKSVWLNLVRYSEVLLGKTNDAKRETITVFFVPNKQRTQIDEIIGANTKKIIKKVKLTIPYAKTLISLNTHVPHTLNAQVNLTLSDLRELCDFHIE